jgi:hypothetical protein
MAFWFRPGSGVRPHHASTQPKEFSMNHLFSAKSLVASAIALGAIVAGSAAHARTDVTIVHAQPQTVQFGHDSDRFERHGRFDRFDRFDRRSPMGDADHDGIPNRFDRDSRFYDARATWRHAQWGDFDHDGVVNAFDRAPRNPRRH